MKIKNIKWFTGSLMTAALAAGISACSDDHFDITSDAAGKQTIWKTIQADEQLSEFADILQSVYYSKNEQKTTPETYADLLNNAQTFTVWAPVNGSFNYDYYKGLIESGLRDSIYKVERELIRNNITRYSRSAIGKGSVKVNLLNSKSAWLNFDEGTFQGITMQESNVRVSNGALHILPKPTKYLPNLYEYMGTRDDFSGINEFIKKFQKTEFNEYASTQGPTIDGKITWVDSVTSTSNDYSNYYVGAFLEREDSNYVMILPTNTAWNAILEKTQQYFKMKDSYKQDFHTTTEAGGDATYSKEKTFTEEELDSIMNFYSKDVICRNLVFNANWQYKRSPISTLDDIKTLDEKGDSLYSTAGRKFKKTGTLNADNPLSVVEIDNYADMFGNADPVTLSNGSAYVVDQFPYPYTIFAPTLDQLLLDYADTKTINDSRSGFTSVTYVKPTVTIDGEDIQPDSTFKYSIYKAVNKSSSSNPKVDFRLSNVLSCKYDIYVVFNYNTDLEKPNKFTVSITYDSEKKREKNQKFKNPNEDAVDAKGATIYNTNNFVNRGVHFNENGYVDYTDTICVAKDFEFPISYYGLGNDAYPVIEITSTPKSTEKEYCRELWINSIILKSKEW
jgi:hypothetical protein